MNHYFYFFFLVVLNSSCTADLERSPGKMEPAYFPLQEFLEVQAQKLDQKGIKKLVKIKGESEKLEETLSEEQWLLELDLFRQADINKPALLQSYDTQRSDEYLIHELKKGEKGKIKKLVIRYAGEQVKEISFQAESENVFYTSKSRGVLSMHSETGLLDQISIEATQQVVFLAPNKILVTASVVQM